MKLSIEKCLVMHCGKKNANYEYFIDGGKLNTTSRAKGLGVLMTPGFNYCEQTREAVNKAARQANFILRCFVLTDADVYMKLFQTYVLPILTYCLPVWRPRYKKDRRLIQAVFSSFRRRVDYSCKREKETLPRTDVDALLEELDQKMFLSIRRKSIF